MCIKMKSLTCIIILTLCNILAFNLSEGIRRHRRNPQPQLGEFNQNLKPREPFKIAGTSEDFKTGFVAISGRNSARGVNFDDNKNSIPASALIEKNPIWVIPYVAPSDAASSSRINAGRSKDFIRDSTEVQETTTILPLEFEDESMTTGIYNDAPSVN